MILSPRTARAATVAGIGGSLLAAIAIVKLLSEGLRRDVKATWVAVASRIALVAPVLVLVLAALRGEPSPRLQWAALLACGWTIVLATLSGVVGARGLPAARAALILLLVGELIELGWPIAHVAYAPGSAMPRFFDRAGGVSEFVAFLGGGVALAWALRSASRAFRGARLGIYAAFPAFVCVFASVFVATVDRRFAIAVARAGFGVRFDALAAMRNPLFVTTPDLVVYLLIPQALFAAAALSLAGVMVDRASASRRALGWVAVLVAGFGALRLSGPMDPARLVVVTLAFLLLERAAILEAQDA